jgi:hypothetical protein
LRSFSPVRDDAARARARRKQQLRRSKELSSFLPFADKRALGVCDTFERGVYRMADASR